MDIGLYGEAAPESVALFQGLCGSGTLPPELRYRSSSCTRIEQGKSIVCGRLSAGSAARIDREIDATGYVRSSLVSLAEQYTTADANALSHDRAGLVSMKKGGGQFEFVLTPAANPALDASNIVIGEVISGRELLQALDNVPTRRPSKDSEVGGLIWALGACAQPGLAWICSKLDLPNLTNPAPVLASIMHAAQIMQMTHRLLWVCAPLSFRYCSMRRSWPARRRRRALPVRC